jgi:hypothetical protein
MTLGPGGSLVTSTSLWADMLLFIIVGSPQHSPQFSSCMLPSVPSRSLYLVNIGEPNVRHLLFYLVPF